MMFLLRMLMRRGGGHTMDPLHVSMTGVRMGERFLLVGCSDKALLSGLAAKVGLSGTAAVAAFDAEQVKRAAGVAAKVGALIETRTISPPALPFDSDQFDLVVIDDTNAAFGTIADASRVAYLREALRALRHGGRIEVVEGQGQRPPGYDALRDLATAGFKPVRLLAERDSIRFIEGLRTTA